MSSTKLSFAFLFDQSMRLDKSNQHLNKEQRTSQRIGEKRTFLQLPLAQVGVDFDLTLPVTTEHSLSRCMFIRIFGSWPGRTATGVLQRGPNRKSHMNTCNRLIKYVSSNRTYN